MSFCPTSVDPVKLSLRVRGSRMSGSITLPEDDEVMTFSTPSGRPDSARICVSASIDSGVSFAGLTTIVQPAAIAGADLARAHRQREVPRRDEDAQARRPTVGHSARHRAVRSRRASSPSSWTSRPSCGSNAASSATYCCFPPPLPSGWSKRRARYRGSGRADELGCGRRAPDCSLLRGPQGLVVVEAPGRREVRGVIAVHLVAEGFETDQRAAQRLLRVGCFRNDICSPGLGKRQAVDHFPAAGSREGCEVIDVNFRNHVLHPSGAARLPRCHFDGSAAQAKHAVTEPLASGRSSGRAAWEHAARNLVLLVAQTEEVRGRQRARDG